LVLRSRSFWDFGPSSLAVLAVVTFSLDRWFLEAQKQAKVFVCVFFFVAVNHDINENFKVDLVVLVKYVDKSMRIQILTRNDSGSRELGYSLGCNSALTYQQRQQPHTDGQIPVTIPRSETWISRPFG
jgi:hypothetical protein